MFDFSDMACSAGMCVYGHPGGMATQGGCHCLEGLNPVKRRKARKAIYAMRRITEREASEKEMKLSRDISDLKFELEVAWGEVEVERKRAEEIYEGNMRKKKKLRDKITALEKELLLEKAKSDNVAKIAMNEMQQLTQCRERESHLIKYSQEATAELESVEATVCTCVALIDQIVTKGRALESSCLVHEWDFVNKHLGIEDAP